MDELNAQDHKEEWGFYFCWVDNRPGSIYLDLGLKEIAPIKGKGNIFWVSIPMNDLREDGMSSQEESSKLWEIEDLLVKGMTDNHDVIFAGRLTNNGTRDFYFYFGEEILIDRTVSEVMIKFPNYEYNFGIKENDNWESYFNFLYPAPRDYQSIMNRRVLEQLEKNGDALTEARLVDHWIYFNSEIDRERFGVEVLMRNFQIKDESIGENVEYQYKLVISREDKVGWNEIDEYTIGLWELANEFNGDYGGWGSPVITTPSSSKK